MVATADLFFLKGDKKGVQYSLLCSSKTDRDYVRKPTQQQSIVSLKPT
jgi:hypothetical protein